ncbi:hypothetical protein MTR_3g077220 [Medicago truncatula]|uniref:Uncharacterized protein n=1 Tax=Medicago truncatula TaxID=3880 RepID=G7J4U1_MEDTR|nr:hypothetical protein MTR_3g077220 [Medicago truncatula]
MATQPVSAGSYSLRPDFNGKKPNLLDPDAGAGKPVVLMRGRGRGRGIHTSAGKPIPIGAGLGVKFLSPLDLGRGLGTMKHGRVGYVKTRPCPAPLPYLNLRCYII